MPHNSRKYLLNEDFFANWSSAVAYVLGFWYADGYMKHDRSYRVRFFSKDYQIVESIRNTMDSTNPIASENQCFALTLHSKKLFKGLSGLGGMRCKSRKMRFPGVPYKYLRDFIRGYFDGDGSVHFVTYKATKNGKYYTHLRSNFTTGSIKFIEDVGYVLFSFVNISLKKIVRDETHYKLTFGEKDTKKLLRWMYYPDNPIALRRKEKFLKEI